jgi:hypothetical protein
MSLSKSNKRDSEKTLYVKLPTVKHNFCTWLDYKIPMKNFLDRDAHLGTSEGFDAEVGFTGLSAPSDGEENRGRPNARRVIVFVAIMTIQKLPTWYCIVPA